MNPSNRIGWWDEPLPAYFMLSWILKEVTRSEHIKKERNNGNRCQKFIYRMEFKVVYLNHFIKFYGTEISVSMEKDIVEGSWV